MAQFAEIDQKEWLDWVSSRPKVVRELCKKYPPDRLYRLKTSGHRVTIYSYSEDGTMTVDVTGQYNKLTFDRRVFGIQPEDMEECDLPGDQEELGTVLTDRKDIDAFINAIRPIIVG